MQALELFVGAGGLALGTAMAGFNHLGLVERDSWACATISENKRRQYPLSKDWPLLKGDVRRVDLSSVPRDIDLVAGGPPCQPFSLGGKHGGNMDERDMFPATVDIIRRVMPKAFIVENVKGLTRSSFANYYAYIKLQLSFPEIARKKDEPWWDHFMRLQPENTSRPYSRKGLAYNVTETMVNAADFGVPQRRERVFLVGFRTDLGIRWRFPDEMHSLDALLVDQWVTGDYWERHRVARRARPGAPANWGARITELRRSNQRPDEYPWRTVRDALEGMPDPERAEGIFEDHHHQPGARVYPGHTGSPIDLPAKTLKAGDHGVPGGENMLVKADGTVRYFTVRESARIQTFPDGYVFRGSWTEVMRQLGNAVPVALARIVASSVADKLIHWKMARLSNMVRTLGHA